MSHGGLILDTTWIGFHYNDAFAFIDLVGATISNEIGIPATNGATHDPTFEGSKWGRGYVALAEDGYPAAVAGHNGVRNTSRHLPADSGSWLVRNTIESEERHFIDTNSGLWYRDADWATVFQSPIGDARQLDMNNVVFINFGRIRLTQ